VYTFFWATLHLLSFVVLDVHKTRKHLWPYGRQQMPLANRFWGGKFYGVCIINSFQEVL